MSKTVGQKHASKSGKGMTIEILRGANVTPRYIEMRDWLRKNKPNMSLAEYSIDSEPGKSKWFEANKHFGQTSLPQVVLVHPKGRMHFSDVSELENYFLPKTKIEIKEMCES